MPELATNPRPTHHVVGAATPPSTPRLQRHPCHDGTSKPLALACCRVAFTCWFGRWLRSGSGGRRRLGNGPRVRCGFLLHGHLETARGAVEPEETATFRHLERRQYNAVQRWQCDGTRSRRCDGTRGCTTAAPAAATATPPRRQHDGTRRRGNSDVHGNVELPARWCGSRAPDGTVPALAAAVAGCEGACCIGAPVGPHRRRVVAVEGIPLRDGTEPEVGTGRHPSPWQECSSASAVPFEFWAPPVVLARAGGSDFGAAPGARLGFCDNHRMRHAAAGLPSAAMISGTSEMRTQLAMLFFQTNTLSLIVPRANALHDFVGRHPTRVGLTQTDRPSAAASACGGIDCNGQIALGSASLTCPPRPRPPRW